MTNAPHQTTAEHKQTGTDPQLSRPVKLCLWFRDNVWLIIGCVVVLAIVPSGAKNAESPEDLGLQQALAGMEQTRRDHMNSRIQAWNQLTDTEQESIRRLHTAVSDNDELTETFENYRAWLAGAPGDPDAIRNEILSEPDPRKRVQIVSRHLGRQDSSGPKPAETTGPAVIGSPPSSMKPDTRPNPFFGAKMRGPVLIGQEFDSAIEIIAAWCELPDTTHGQSLIDMFEYQLKVISDFDRKLRVIQNGQIRPVVALHKPTLAIINTVKDEERRFLIALEIETKPVNLMLLLIRSIRTEAIRKVNSVSKTDLDRLIEDVSVERQRFLKLNKSQDFRRRLMLLWLEEKHPELWDMVRSYARLTRDPAPGRKTQNRRPDQQRPQPGPQQQ